MKPVQIGGYTLEVSEAEAMIAACKPFGAELRTTNWAGGCVSVAPIRFRPRGNGGRSG